MLWLFECRVSGFKKDSIWAFQGIYASCWVAEVEEASYVLYLEGILAQSIHNEGLGKNDFLELLIASSIADIASENAHVLAKSLIAIHH
jgi:hypothetical protein